MIAKLQTISYTMNALMYCARGGEYLYSNQCLGSPKEIYGQMQKHEVLNDRCEKKSFHIKIRLAPEDKGKLSTTNWLEITKAYAQKIGFQENPFAVYIHEEGTENEHIHIVASRINNQNFAVNNSFTNYKNMDFCRWAESEYNLRRVKRRLEQLKEQKVFLTNDDRLNKIKNQVDRAIKNSKSIEEVVRLLERKSIQVKTGRGITFVDNKGVSFKGSKLGRGYSLAGIKKQVSIGNHFFKRRPS